MRASPRYPHLWEKPPVYKVKISVREVRAKLRQMKPEVFGQRDFNWNQPAFYAPRGEVTVCLHSFGQNVYDTKLVAWLTRDAAERYPGRKFKPASIMVLVALALKYPKLFVWPGAFSALAFERSGLHKYYVSLEQEKGVLKLELTQIGRGVSGDRYDFGAGNGFIVQEVWPRG